MAYILYSVSFFLLVLATVLYLTRPSWLPHIPFPHLYSRLPSFSRDIESGLSSSTFDLATNLAAGDSRAGLDEHGRREVQRLMRKHRVTFDEARRMYVEQTFERNGVGKDGMPRDPKAFVFS